MKWKWRVPWFMRKEHTWPCKGFVGDRVDHAIDQLRAQPLPMLSPGHCRRPRSSRWPGRDYTRHMRCWGRKDHWLMVGCISIPLAQGWLKILTNVVPALVNRKGLTVRSLRSSSGKSNVNSGVVSGSDFARRCSRGNGKDGRDSEDAWSKGLHFEFVVRVWEIDRLNWKVNILMLRRRKRSANDMMLLKMMWWCWEIISSDGNSKLYTQKQTSFQRSPAQDFEAWMLTSNRVGLSSPPTRWEAFCPFKRVLSRWIQREKCQGQWTSSSRGTSPCSVT
jgi:hypothetical protein